METEAQRSGHFPRATPLASKGNNAVCHQLGASHGPEGGRVTRAWSHGHQVCRPRPGLTPTCLASPQCHTAPDAAMNHPPLAPGFHLPNSHWSHKGTLSLLRSPRHSWGGGAARVAPSRPQCHTGMEPSSRKRRFPAELCCQKPGSRPTGRRLASPEGPLACPFL